MRKTPALLGIAWALACSSSPPETPSRTVAMGPDAVAQLFADGRLVIRRNGQVILSTPPGKPLFSRDLDDPSPYHDPKRLDSVTLTPVADSLVSIDSPSADVLHLSTSDDGMATALVSLALATDDGFYTGLGERFDHTDPRGEIVGMQLEIDLGRESGTTDRHVPVPWIVSSKGYAVFVASREAGAFDVGSSDPGVLRSTFEGKTMDVTIVTLPDPLEDVAALARMTGTARHTPLWALSPMMWRHVDTQAQVTSDLAMIRSLHIPTSTFWLDDGWQVALNTFDLDPAKYNDPAALAAQATALGFELMGWSTPYLENPSSGPPDEAQQLYAQAKAAGYFVETDTGAPFSPPGAGGKTGFGMIDFTNPAARGYWAGLVGKGVASGMNGFKLDYGEDMIPALLGSRLNLKLSDGSSERTARLYPLGYHGAYRDALAKTSDGGVLIVRASTYGGAAVADIIWPGDLDNGFEHDGDPQPPSSHLVGGLPASVVAAQTLAASGFPTYGADTGGYRGGGPTKEALLRWAEHTALSMVMQLGPGEDKYPWSYDTETVSIYKDLASLHQKLYPYLASLLGAAIANGTPTIRPLPLAFPDDTDARAFADDEYLLGPALLVAPVITPGATSRSVHVPPGAWFSWWDGTRVDGPKTLDVAAPLGKPPLFAKAGTMVPMLPDGIDTVLPSTDASTVSITTKNGLAEASAWVSGWATASFIEGSTVTIDDAASGVDVKWAPSGTGSALTIAIDLRARTGKTAALSMITMVSGQAMTSVATEADVRSATGSAYFLSGDRVVMRMVGPTEARVE